MALADRHSQPMPIRNQPAVITQHSAAARKRIWPRRSIGGPQCPASKTNGMRSTVWTLGASSVAPTSTDQLTLVRLLT